MAALRIILLGFFMVISLLVAADCTARMFIDGTPVDENPALQTAGYLIYDIGALIIWLVRLLVETVFFVFTLGIMGDPLEAMLVILQCATSFVYHSIAFGLTVLFLPANMLDSASVMFFDTLGLDTSTNDDGEEYVAFQDVPIFGFITGGIDFMITQLHNSVISMLGDPDRHEGGLYEIINVEVREDNPLPWGDEIVIGLPTVLEDPIYDILDPPIEFFTNITQNLLNQWENFEEAELFPIGLINTFVGTLIDFVMVNMLAWMLVEDTYLLFWSGLGMIPPATWFVVDQDFSADDWEDDNDAGFEE